MAIQEWSQLQRAKLIFNIQSMIDTDHDYQIATKLAIVKHSSIRTSVCFQLPSV